MLEEQENDILEIVYKNPIVLLNKQFDKHRNFINNLLPYSIGIEIECFEKQNCNKEGLLNIPYLMRYSGDGSEQRFRIPKGLAGLICLYFIGEQLTINCELNDLSGIHYHTDMTDQFQFIDKNNLLKYDWILKHLEKWDYKLTSNRKEIKYDTKYSWANFRSSFKTIEIRIGEMTFDYEIMLKRIIDCCYIVTKLNKNINNKYQYKQDFIIPNKNDIIDFTRKYSYLKEDKVNINNLKKLLTIEEKIELKPIVNFNEKIKNREIKCY